MKLKRLVLATAAFTLSTAFVSMAGSWRKGICNPNNWWYDNGDGTYPHSAWVWLDGNKDGIAECYYFDKDGWMLANTRTPDGYTVNGNGAWVENGRVQVKTSSAMGGRWKKGISRPNDWWYDNGDGTYPHSAWAWLDGNNDGTAECYYFDKDGWMLANTKTPDGFTVNGNGAWVENNRVQVKVVPLRGNKGYQPGVITERSGSRISRSRGGGSGSGSGGGSDSGGGSILATNSNTVAPQNQNYKSADSYRIPSQNLSNNNAGANQANQTGQANQSGQNNQNNQTGNQSLSQVNELTAQGLSVDEAKLYLLINAYRVQKGLPKLSFSKSLTQVARTHVQDSNTYHPENQRDARGMQGNLHSWSANGSWTPVVYTSDSRYAAQMWSKPSELTAYTSYGYEISAGGSGTITPEQALNLWMNSSAHNAVITGSGQWGMLTTMGVGISGSYAHVWFGSEADPAGYYTVTD